MRALERWLSDPDLVVKDSVDRAVGASVQLRSHTDSEAVRSFRKQGQTTLQHTQKARAVSRAFELFRGV
jgi:hypothetical protein